MPRVSAVIKISRDKKSIYNVIINIPYNSIFKELFKKRFTNKQYFKANSKVNSKYLLFKYCKKHLVLKKENEKEKKSKKNYEELFEKYGIKFKNKKALIAEDDKTNSMYESILLKKLGLDVITASNGEEAIKCVKNNNFDIIFMDVSMPIIDGYEATSAIRKIKGCKTPIIATTAYSENEIMKKCMDVGMNDFLLKPIYINAIIKILLKWI